MHDRVADDDEDQEYQSSYQSLCISGFLNKCPKPSGQAFRPLPPNGQCPNVEYMNEKGSSPSEACIDLWLNPPVCFLYAEK